MDEETKKQRFAPHVPFVAVMALVLAAIIWIALRHWRQGTIMIGGALLIAAVLRGVLDDNQAGLLAIRSRRADIFMYSGLGVVLIFTAATITGGPLDT